MPKAIVLMVHRIMLVQSHKVHQLAGSPTLFRCSTLTNVNVRNMVADFGLVAQYHTVLRAELWSQNPLLLGRIGIVVRIICYIDK